MNTEHSKRQSRGACSECGAAILGRRGLCPACGAVFAERKRNAMQGFVTTRASKAGPVTVRTSAGETRIELPAVAVRGEIADGGVVFKVAGPHAERRIHVTVQQTAS